MAHESFEIFLSTLPGFEPMALNEVKALGLADPQVVPGGVTFQGGWPDVWQANLSLRVPTRVLARIGSFRAMHLAQLDKRARRFDWSILGEGSVRVEVTCRKSKIYHDRAARQRIERALQEEARLPITAGGRLVMVRIEDDLCTISLDTSGEPLHKRGHKTAVNKAPMRETMAAAFLQMCKYSAEEPLVDPMCGSGTFPIEAAEFAAQIQPGRSRSFAFESFRSFDAEQWKTLRKPRAHAAEAQIFGYDRDQGAIQMSQNNAERASVSCAFACQPISELLPPTPEPGLVIVNPPYGGRIGNKKMLFGLYARLGERLRDHFNGWRLGLVTSERALAKATGLEFQDVSVPIPHGGIRVQLYQARL